MVYAIKQIITDIPETINNIQEALDKFSALCISANQIPKYEKISQMKF